MSRLAKKPLIIPSQVAVNFQDHAIKVDGPKGTLLIPKLDGVEITISGDKIFLQAINSLKQTKMNLGTMWSLIRNSLDGVTRGFFKVLEIEGVGYRASVEGKEIVLKIGFSHPVKLSIPEGIDIKVDKNEIIVSGIDKQLVGQVAANIRKQKKPDPYLGKGIRYKGEVIRRKAGKKAGAASK